MLNAYYYPEEINNNSLVIYGFLGNISYLAQLIVMIEVCCGLSKDNNDMIMILYKLSMATEHDNMKELLNILSMQWGALPMDFTCAGLFKVDRTLYLTV